MSNLSGKTALVTGRLARHRPRQRTRTGRRPGRKSSFTTSSSGKEAEAVVSEIRQAGGRAEKVAAESADAERSATRWPSWFTVSSGPGLDILVANAGISKTASIEDTTVEDFDELFAVNVRRAPTSWCSSCCPPIGRGSSIVFVFPRFAARAFRRHTFRLMAPPRGAVATLVDALRVGTRRGAASASNAVAPGVVENRYVRPLPRPSWAANNHSGHASPESVSPQPDDISPESSPFLASDEARWITGDTVRVDGRLETLKTAARSHLNQ